MPTLNVRNVPKPVYEGVRRIAELDKRSLSQEVLWILERFIEERKVSRSSREARRLAEALREEVRGRIEPLTTEEMVALIREDRDR